MENVSVWTSGLRMAVRHPPLWIFVACWDGLKLALAWWLSAASLGWVRWDFNISLTGGSTGVPYRLVLPPALPSAEQLGITFGAPAVMDWGWMLAAAVPLVAMTVLDPLVRAGYLNLISGTLRGIQPNWNVWWRGVRRFGPGQLFLTVLWIAVALGLLPLLGKAPVLAQVFIPLLVICFFMAQYVIVTDDANPLAAVIGAPALLLGHLDALLPPILLSLVASGAISVTLSLAGGLQPWLAVPIWAFVGAALTATMMSGLICGISTRREPGMPWACGACSAQNAQGAPQCAVCGGRRAG